MEAIAKATNVKGSAQKAKLIVDLIRGRKVSEALALLQFSGKRLAIPVEKVVRSAMDNATQHAEAENVIVDEDDLWIKECYVGKGTTKYRRRVRPAPMGRAYRQQRHYCHITVLVSNDKKSEKREAAA
jgi:large subunit ribosomal protein L22